MVLVELISDDEEEDEGVSNKAYQCLEVLGEQAVKEMIARVKEINEETVVKWKQGGTIMLDVFMKRERHVYLKSFDGQLDPRMRPNIREFGPKSEDDLLDQRNIQTLEKLLPVLNGLIYLK